MAKETFLVYKSYFDRFAKLTDEQMGKVFRAMLEYEITGKEPIIDDPKAEASFEVVKYDLDMNDGKYEEICRKRREAGSLGGKQKVANATKCYQMQASVSKSKQNVPHNDSDSDNLYDNGEHNPSGLIINNIIPSDISSQKRGDFVSKRKEEVEAVLNAWNSIPNIPSVKMLDRNTERYKMLCARLDKYGLDAVLEAVSNIRHSTFLCGGGDKGWHIDFGWFVRPNNFPKVYEGKYSDTVEEHLPKVSRAISVIDDMIAKGLISNDG